MKKLIILAFSLFIGFGSFAGEIDDKLVQSFKTSFPHAEQVSWYELKDLWVVNFIENGIRNRIAYQKDGAVVSFNRYYGEKDLPVYVRYQITKKYSGKSIFGVIELITINNPGEQLGVEYYIKLEDDKNWITVKMDSDRNLSVVERYRKAL